MDSNHNLQVGQSGRLDLPTMMAGKKPRVRPRPRHFPDVLPLNYLGYSSFWLIIKVLVLSLCEVGPVETEYGRTYLSPILNLGCRQRGMHALMQIRTRITGAFPGALYSCIRELHYMNVRMVCQTWKRTRFHLFDLKFTHTH